MRLTKNMIQKILEQNNGFSRRTSYSSRNYSADLYYIIENGRLLVEKFSKTSWSDSKETYRYVADIEQTRRFLRKFIDHLDLTGLE